MSETRSARRCRARLVSFSPWLSAAIIAVTAAWPGAAAAGCLEQMELPAGCVSNGGAAGCSSGIAMAEGFNPAISPDGRNVYLGSFTSDAVDIFDRDTVTGLLTQKPGTAGCISDTGTGGACVDGRALDGAQELLVTPDGKYVYATSILADSIGVFDRNETTGELTQKAGTAGCVSDTGSGGECADAAALNGANDIAMSPDGENIYVVSTVSNSITVFDRALDGTLTQKAGTDGCTSQFGDPGVCTTSPAVGIPSSVAVSPDGRNVYLAANVLVVFDRDLVTGAITQKAGTEGCFSEAGGICQVATAVVGLDVVILSPDGKNLYTGSGFPAGDSALAIFDRDLITGALTQKPGTAGCISPDGDGGACATGRGFAGVADLQISADGENIYAVLWTSDGLAILDRDVATGALEQRAGTEGCINAGGTDGCAAGAPLGDAVSAVMGPEDDTLYVATRTQSALVGFDRFTCPGDTTTTTTTTSTTTTTLALDQCPEEPRTDCHENSGAARIKIVASDTGSDKIEFVWKLGEATSLSDGGDPVGGDTVYTLCIYDNGSLVDTRAVPPGGDCDGEPCWREIAERKLVYSDKAGSSDGMRELVVRSGEEGQARVYAHAKAADLGVTALPMTLPVQVQLVAGDPAGSHCWDALFSVAAKSTDRKFEAVRR